jgi:hypothetical protein
MPKYILYDNNARKGWVDIQFPSRKEALAYVNFSLWYHNRPNGYCFDVYEVVNGQKNRIGMVVRQPIRQSRYRDGTERDYRRLIKDSQVVNLYETVYPNQGAPKKIIQKDGTLKSIPKGWLI